MKPRDHFRRLLARLLQDPRVADDRWLAYILATVRHETAATWEPILERGGPQWFARYENRQDLGNVNPGDGARFAGRGYVQITGRANYTRFMRLLGRPLLEQPELACDPEVAYEILVRGMIDGLFTGVGLRRVILPSTQPDYTGARRIVNGNDKADLIAGYARQYESLLARIGEAA